MRNRLLKDGKIISYGIQFDVNSDKLKPESYSTLKEIADILKENPTIRIQVVGHTDSDGDKASNLDLSKRRGASVKNELVNKFACDAARLETDGKGESEPIADNNSAVNKAKNRRVEFINTKDKESATVAAAAAVPAIASTAKTSDSLTDIAGNGYKIVIMKRSIRILTEHYTTGIQLARGNFVHMDGMSRTMRTGANWSLSLQGMRVTIM